MQSLYSNKSVFKFAVTFEFSARVRLRFYQKLGQLLENGVPLDMALGQIQQLSNKSKSSVLPVLYARWRRNVSNGVNFGQCMAPYVPASEAMLLETGADSGHLAAAVRQAHDSVEAQGRIKQAIIASSAYPAVLVAMLIAALLMSAYMILPTFEEILPPSEWQGVAKYVAIAARAIRDYGLYIFIFIVLMIIIISMSLAQWSGPSRKYVENMVPWNLYRMWQGSSFLLSVASLMRAGVKLDEVSIGKISKNADPYLAVRIQALRKWIISGSNFGDALHQTGYEFPDPEIIADLRIYARLRGFEENLDKIVRTWIEDLVADVSVAMKVLNFVVLVLIAVTIGVLISSLYGVIQQVQTQA